MPARPAPKVDAAPPASEWERQATQSPRLGAPVTSPASHPLLALQRSIGNRATCELLQRQPGGGSASGPTPGAFLGERRLVFPTAPEYSGDASKMSDFTLMRIWTLYKKGELYVSEANLSNLKSVMGWRGLDTRAEGWAANPMDAERARMKTRGAGVAEIAKPAGVGAAAFGGSHLAGGHSSTSAAQSSIGGGVVSAALLGDAAMGLYGAYGAHGEAQKRGDVAGMHVATGRAKTAGWGVAGGSAGAAEVGLKVGHSLGSAAVGLTAAAGGLGIAGGAITVAQGLWKIVKSGRKLNKLSDVAPLTEPGRGWKGFISGREQRKIGVNALKVAAGALGIAAGALFIVSNPVGWAVGIAAMVTGGVVAGFKLFQKIKKTWKQRSAKKKMEGEGGMDELARPAPGDHKPGSPEEQEARRKQVRALADKVQAECSQGSRYASEMRGAIQGGDSDKGHFARAARDTFRPDDADLSQTLASLPERTGLQVSVADLKAYDAMALLDILNVTKEEALSESGQDLIARKMSVSTAS